jgi:hypothetical protein
MTQLPSDISVAQILESLDVINIADEALRQIIEILPKVLYRQIYYYCCHLFR